MCLSVTGGGNNNDERRDHLIRGLDAMSSGISHPAIARRIDYEDEDDDEEDDEEDDEDDDEVPTLQILDEDNETPRADIDSSPPRRPLPPPVVPVTILTGFLGSGKSTLVRHILTSPNHDRRIAVIENEFGGGDNGEVDDDDGVGGRSLAERMGLSVETLIVRDGTSSSDSSNLLVDLIELPNGCVCCTVKDSLVETLERLLDMRTDLDYVLIEASGMADPGPVASIFWLDGALESRLRLDGIVACVDARNIVFQLECTSSCAAGGGRGEGGDEAARQIAFADRIIVNKVDLLGRRLNPDRHDDECDNDGDGKDSAAATAIESVIRRIEGINPTAPIRTTTYSRVDDLEWILDANCFDAGRAMDVEAAFRRLSTDDDNDEALFRGGRPCADAFCIGNHSPPNDFDRDVCGLCSSGKMPYADSRHRHTDAVGTIALFGVGSVNLHRINSWLASILWPDQDESDKVLRARLEGRDVPSSFSRYAQSSERHQGIYRVKGILSVGHVVDDRTRTVAPESNDYVDEGLAAGLVDPRDGLDERRFIVQAVNDLWDVLPASEDLCWDAAETRCCKVIIIGKWLDEGRLRDGFGDCFLSPPE